MMRVIDSHTASQPTLVGALLCTPNDPSCTTGVIFFDSCNYFGMCGHGIIGVVATLEYLGLIRGHGSHRIENPCRRRYRATARVRRRLVSKCRQLPPQE